MRTVRMAILLMLALAIPGRGLAWNHKGHMTVAYIAYQQLSPAERTRVVATLKAHPDLQMLLHHAGSSPMMLFITAARWPDLIRDDNRFYDETDPHAERILPKAGSGFPDMKKHKPWHFMDLGFSTDGTAVSEPDHINAQTAIHAFRQSIGNPQVSAAHKAYFLAWLEHLVGDVHQPLHCVARFSHEHPRGDRGGNFFDIAPFQPPGLTFKVDNLHSLWDDAEGGETTLTAVKALAAKAEASTPTESVDVADEGVWINESFEYAKSAAYKPLEGQGDKPTISPAYFDGTKALVLKRIKLAGHRLAALIKSDLK